MTESGLTAGALLNKGRESNAETKKANKMPENPADDATCYETRYDTGVPTRSVWYVIRYFYELVYSLTSLAPANTIVKWFPAAQSL